MIIESHPLQPFLPTKARILFLGSFPPPHDRWSMEFFYPNFRNDFWRVMGLCFYADALHFEVEGEKRFDVERVTRFAEIQGFAFYDTATQVCRLRNNASDEHLEILKPTDVSSLLACIPDCHDIVTTGGKASEELQKMLPYPMPRIGECSEGIHWDRPLRWWRMPSTSRAYPLALQRKADFYAELFSRVLNYRTGQIAGSSV